MRIGELSRRTGASVRSLRYYESRSLLTSRRSANGYRDFDEDQVAQVATIRQLLEAGLSLDTVAVVAPCYTDGVIEPRCDRAQERARRQLEELDRRAAAIDAARAVLRRLFPADHPITTVPSEPPDGAPTRNGTPSTDELRLLDGVRGPALLEDVHGPGDDQGTGRE